MRQVLSTALVACVVGALTGASFGAMAQSPAEPPVSPTALDADTVDRLSAVKATSNKQARANKLVATDAKGFLPANIVKAKWGLIGGKPAVLADGQVGWNEVAGVPASLADGQVGWEEVAGIPAGLADGVDDVGNAGYVSFIEGTHTVPADDAMWLYVDAAVGVDIEVTFIPTSVGDEVFLDTRSYERFAPTVLRHWFYVTNFEHYAPTEFKLRVRMFNQGIAPAVLKKAAKAITVGVSKKGPRVE